MTGIYDGGFVTAAFIIEMGGRSIRDVSAWGFIVRHTP
jgi:hypothetical protein